MHRLDTSYLAHGFLAAQGLLRPLAAQGLHLALIAQGFLAAQGLHFAFAAQGLHRPLAAHGLHCATWTPWGTAFGNGLAAELIRPAFVVAAAASFVCEITVRLAKPMPAPMARGITVPERSMLR